MVGGGVVRACEADVRGASDQHILGTRPCSERKNMGMLKAHVKHHDCKNRREVNF
jgi:hypothetical protein